MSYTELFKITPKGNIKPFAGFQNSFRGAAYVWQMLEKKYLPEYHPDWWHPGMSYTPTRFGDMKAMEEVWGIWELPNCQDHERIVLLTTFDRVYVLQKDFPRLCDAFEKFGEENPKSSFIAQAAEIRKLIGMKTAWGICWNQTSVNEGYDSMYGNISKAEKPFTDIFPDFDDLKNPVDDGMDMKKSKTS